MKMRHLLVLILLLLAPAWAWAVPAITNVTGTLTDGSTITITGTGFGAHADNDVMGTSSLSTWYDAFDTYQGVSSGTPKLIDEYSVSNPGNVTIATNQKRGVSSLEFMPSTNSSKTATNVRVFEAGGTWYVSQWFFIPSDYYLTGNEQWKLFRSFPTSGVIDNWYWGIAIASYNLGWHGEDGANGGGGCTSCFAYPTVPMVSNMTQLFGGRAFLGNWHRGEIWVDVANDEALNYIDGRLVFDANVTYPDFWPATLQIADINRWCLDNTRQASATNYGWMDDLYIDNTWARVEVCQTNAFTESGSSYLVKNVQKPLTWVEGTPDTITAELDLEGITLPAYLFVVDSAGAVSASYLLASGAECDGPEDCDDSNPCTDDSCTLPAGTCAHANNTAACNDGLYCTLTDVCAAGVCGGSGDPCTACFTCNEATDACDLSDDTDVDGYYDDACAGGTDCLDTNAAVYPGAQEGPYGDATCSDALDNDCDGNVDVADSLCLQCVVAADCNDANACTDDSCVASACVNANNTAACDDSLFCNGADTCAAGTCSTHAGSPCPGDCPPCDEGLDQCTGLDADEDGYISDACGGGDDCLDSNAAVKPSATEGPLGDATCSDSLDNNCNTGTDIADGGCSQQSGVSALRSILHMRRNR